MSKGWPDGDADAAPADVVTILEALQAEMELYLRTRMRVSEARVILWLHEVRQAVAQAKKANG